MPKAANTRGTTTGHHRRSLAWAAKFCKVLAALRVGYALVTQFEAIGSPTTNIHILRHRRISFASNRNYLRKRDRNGHRPSGRPSYDLSLFLIRLPADSGVRSYQLSS